MSSDDCQRLQRELSACARRPNAISGSFCVQFILALSRLELLWRLIRIAAALAVLIAILGATLYPFNWLPPRISNAAAYQAAGGIEFRDMGIAYTSMPPSWLTDVIRTHALDIMLDVGAAANQQQIPARILTISQDIHHRNLTIDQQTRDLSIRLRTADRDENGMPPITIPGVFGRPGGVEIRLRIEPEALTIWINREVRLNQRLPGAPLKKWNPSYRLALGNEFSGDQSWLGKIDHALVTVGGTSIDYAIPGALEVPLHYWFPRGRFYFNPLWNTSWTDRFNNILLFAPLGFVLGLLVNGDSLLRNAGLTLIISCFSTTIEVLQLGLVGRFSSLSDILFNTVGGVLGLALACWLVREYKRRLFRRFERCPVRDRPFKPLAEPLPLLPPEDPSKVMLARPIESPRCALVTRRDAQPTHRTVEREHFR